MRALLFAFARLFTTGFAMAGFAMAGFFMISAAKAELVIEITRGADDALPIAIVPFGGPQFADNIASIVSADLERSGRFRPLPDNALGARPTHGGDVLYSEWKNVSANHLLVGSVRQGTDGRHEIRYELFSLDRQTRLLGESLTVASAQWRDAAHFVADKVFEAITGVRGDFSTRILYVNVFPKNGKRTYRLELADADGQRPVTILESPEPILSPGWSPDGRKVAYVSFESGRPAIFMQNIASQERQKLASFSGLNGAPAWSPDGRKLALTLSRDGNPEIYLMDIESRALTRLTNHPGIDTEPRWAPDSKSLVFTSDRGGSAQIYRLSLADLAVKRLTFEGNYNARADISPDGRYLALVHRQRGQQFQIALQDVQSGVLTTLTQTPLDESPSFSPNGLSLVYATRRGAYGELAIVSVDGRSRVRLPARLGEVREPSWSPFLRP
ncbi:MAG: Tol-Pal system beta propeller repeat protein TolB [Moraxellaceae bacterium]|nr:Tol-Pal system beta propeller repeat protein TolB [Moraxellaceae bacterium]